MREETSNLVPQAKQPARTDLFLVFCRLLNIITGISAALCLVAHGMSFVVGPPIFETLTAALDQSLRLYGVMFAALTVAIETDWRRFMNQILLFDGWIARGFFQLFLAVLTLSIAVSDGDDDYHKSLQLYRKISALCLVGCACVYLSGGIMCFGYIKTARTKKVIELGRLHVALHKLEKQEQEMRNTLARYSSV